MALSMEELFGFTVMLLLYLLSSIMGSGFMLSIHSIILIVSAIVSGMLGGMIGVNI